MQSFYIDSSFGDMMELDNQFHKMLFTIARKEQVFTLMNNIAESDIDDYADAKITV